ncbi:MAG: hypothetical protein DRP47_04965 [Candidatus Zixiibacteriota bacterium]|nr:MAG: hypothetical protein DRP47_04965 [candidate division Zixibacteria bacterium]
MLGMGKKTSFLKCYTATFNGNLVDPYLANMGFASGMISFAIPDFGVLFRCRAHGSKIDLEFGAFFALLGFLKTRLSDQDIKAVQIMSSNPEFVFSFSGKRQSLAQDKERARLLLEYSREYVLAISYVKSIENRALLSPTDYASLPSHIEIELKPDPSDTQKSGFKPIRKGIRL